MLPLIWAKLRYLNIFAYQLVKMYGVEYSSSPPRLHVSPHPNHGLQISQALIEKFKLFHDDDYINYRKSLEIVQKKFLIL